MLPISTHVHLHNNKIFFRILIVKTSQLLAECEQFTFHPDKDHGEKKKKGPQQGTFFFISLLNNSCTKILMFLMGGAKFVQDSPNDEAI